MFDVISCSMFCVIRNALSLAMLESIKERLTEDVDSPDLRVIILRASGPVFSSGHNLNELVKVSFSDRD